MVIIAERRMISKKVVESARFIKMPASSQNLYFHLVLNADDDRVVEAFTVMNLIRVIKDAQNAAAYMDYKAGLITEKEYEQARGSVMEIRPREKELER